MQACRRRTAVLALALLAAAACGTAQAQTLEVVHSFRLSHGASKAELVESSDGSFYGATFAGGDYANGSIFRLQPDGGGGYTLTEIHSFFTVDGGYPYGGLIRGADGWFYGTTSFFASGGGTVFAMDPSGHVTTLRSLGGLDGLEPFGRLVVGADGLLYGTTKYGGDHMSGTIFRCDRIGGFATIHSFNEFSDGKSPVAGLVRGPAGDPALYGTTSGGGPNFAGTVFRLDPNGAVSVIHSFDFTNGALPDAALVLGSDGNFYGTTVSGGTSGMGTIFRVSPGGVFTTIHSLAQGEGFSPEGPLLETGPGVFVGTLSGTDSGFGAVFRIESDGSFAILHAFSPDEGGVPFAGLVRGTADGLLYGTTTALGASGNGTVYRIDSDGNFEVVATFDNPDGGPSVACLTQASDGKLYGATSAGGSKSSGSIFRIDAASDAYEVVHALSEDEGKAPLGQMVEFGGNLYGTASQGGAEHFGSIFRLDPASAQLTLLHSFDDADGQSPVAGLVAGSDGFLYGAAADGGEHALGTLYRIDDTGGFTKLWDFAGPEGASPRAPLIQGHDGFLYGTTYGGGGTAGTVYRLDPASGVTPLRILLPADGLRPSGPLFEYIPGAFYGTAENGGANALGTLFQIDIAANLTVLHDFGAPNDGAVPTGRVLIATTGGPYGITSTAGAYGGGTVFRKDPEGTPTVHDFSLNEGLYPSGGLIQATDGYLYGVTFGGGAAGMGTVYRFIFPGGFFPWLNSVTPTSGPAGGGRTVTLAGLHFSSVPLVQIGEESSSGFPVNSRTILAVSPPLEPGSLQDVTVENSGLNVPTTLTDAFFVDFLDVPGFHPFHDFVESIFRAAITAGCGNGNYCPDASVTREQMAVFLLKSEHGGDYLPPACTGVFTDVPCTPGVGFPDWIEQLYAEQITGGCVASPLQYCPGRAVTRAEMAVLLLKTKHGTGYVPNSCAGVFADVPCPATPQFPYSDWIEQLYADAITGGCAVGPLRYCPDNPNLRGEMAVFLVKTFGLP